MTTLEDFTAPADVPPVSEAEQRQRRFKPGLTGLVLVAALVCWAVAMPNLDRGKESQWGLLAVASPGFIASIILTTISFALAIRRGSFALAWAATLLSVLILRFTFSLATAVPYYSWTYKHVGVSEYIQQHGQVARDIDIYHHWPGLFALTSWFSDLTGVSVQGLAHWYSPVAYLIEVAVLYAMARSWDLPRMQAMVCVFLVHNLDWIGQGYFSPQWTAFMMSLGILTLIGLSRKEPRYLALILVLFTAVVATHQLTPYWLIAVAGLLAITRKVKPWWLFIALTAIAIGFLTYNWGVAAQFHLVDVDPSKNIQSNVKTIGILGQRVTSLMVRGLCGSFWVLAGGTAFVQLVRRKPFIGPASVGFASFAILVGQGYGGEAIFRVFLFSLPGCALLISPVVHNVLTTRRRLVMAPALAVLIVWAICSAQGLFGNWYAFRMTDEEVRLSATMLETLPRPAYMTAAAPVWPERASGSYVDVLRQNPKFDEIAVNATQLVGSHFTSDADYAKITAFVAGRGAAPTYLIITRQMQFYDWYFGILPFDALPNLQKRIIADPKWSVYYQSDSVLIFKSNFFPNGGGQK